MYEQHGSVDAHGSPVARVRAIVTRRRVQVVMVAILLVAGVLPVIGLLGRLGLRTLSAQDIAPVHGAPVQAQARPDDLTQGAGAQVQRPVTWPTGSGDVELGGSGRAQAGRLPIWLSRAGGSGVSRAAVSVRARESLPAALQQGVVFDLRRTDADTSPGEVTVEIDYGAFASAYGADWSSRLRLVTVPACALADTDPSTCAPVVELPSTNDVRARTVSASVPIGGTGMTMALVAGADGSNGDFAATSLQPSATWSAGGNSGTFTWNYPIAVPPGLGGPTPNVSLAYSSAAVDGMSEATNNQPSWVGQGFDWAPGFIERSYVGCASDMKDGANNTSKTGDRCWRTDNATMSLNGSGGELVRDDTTGVWRVKGDDNSKVERLNNTVNGDNDNEYWRITTADGTKYYFGLNRLPGYTGTAPANKTTNSVWTVPVAGNHSGEPCHASSFASSFCNQAYRWNLDYVVDLHGNTMSYFYSTATNKYSRNLTNSDAVTYVRDGWLDHIDYGTNNRSGTDTVNTSTAAPMRVTFTTADRCLADCGTHDADHWPDTPWDQECTGSTCAGHYFPTFWTTKRLSVITTKVWNASTSSYKDVNSWTLTHTFPDPGDGTRAGMWLESIVQTGLATGPNVIGGPISLPEVNFDWVQLPNRVDTYDDSLLPMNWMRMSTIWTESGAKIDIRYSEPECEADSNMPASPQTNTLRCYPVLSEEPDGSIKTDYFHKYVVTSVTEEDRTGGGDAVVTSYEYLGGVAWRHTDDNGLTEDKLRTWSDYRGYGQVRTRVGDPTSATTSLTEEIYFRGMHGDLDGAGGTRSVSLPAIDGNGDGDTTDAADAPAVPDEDAYAGSLRYSVVYNGVLSEPVSATISEPWQSAPTASRDMGETTVHARYRGTKTTWTAVNLATGGRRVTRIDTTFDSLGQPIQSDDQGDVDRTDDDKCTVTTYNRNTSINLLTTVGRVEVYGLRCGVTPTTEAQVISDKRTSYDGQAYGVAPTKGEATKVEVAKAWSPSGGSVWLTQSTAQYDAYGRATDITDVRGEHTITVYTPNSGGPVTSVATTNPLGTSATTMEPAWGKPTVTVDMNNKRAEATYDALGRARQVWYANHTKAAYPNAPSTEYTYLIRNSGGVNAVTTARLNAASTSTAPVYTTTIQLLDGLLRERQTQNLSMANGNVGTVFTEIKYDDQGRKILESKHFDNAVQPSTDLFTIADWQGMQQSATEYDRAGRVTATVVRSQGVELWRTTTTYGGDRANRIPPAGGIATTVITDALGRTTELREYHDAAKVGVDDPAFYDVVTYHYDARGNRDWMKDNDNNVWTDTYDLLGRKTASHDPDKGDVVTTYNDAGDVLSTTDERGQTIVFEYDSHGRQIGEYVGSIAPANKLATWSYDPPGFKGQLASSSRWTDNGTVEYKVKIRSYTPLYQSTGEDYVVPAAVTGLAGTYTITRTFRTDGSPSTVTYPAAGGLSAETVTTTYDPVSGLPEALLTNSGQGQYVANTDYTAFGEVAFQQFQLLAGSWVQRSFTYDDQTRRLIQTTTIRQTSPQAVDNTQYTYDPAGNIIRIQSNPASGPTDTQCFATDYAQRLVQAWTPGSGDCAATRDAASLGGPAPYWLSWTFDKAGNRKTQTAHTVSGDNTTEYAYPAAGSDRPHAVTSTTAGGITQTYGYDATGNTVCRPAGAAANTCPAGSGNQTLTWDAEGRLAANTSDTGTSSYIYTPDGTRLIADDPTSVTLYLPGMDITRTKVGGVVTANRYYEFGGRTCAMKTTGGAVTWLLPDEQGTQNISVAAGTQAITARRQLPYGGTRGTPAAWPNTRGFVGGTNDVTGLTHMGAREYDANLGRFLSVDPVLDATNPQSLNAYGYAGNSPITFSDPSGEWFLGGLLDWLKAVISTINALRGRHNGDPATDDCSSSACPDRTALYCTNLSTNIKMVSGASYCPGDDTATRSVPYGSLGAPPSGWDQFWCEVDVISAHQSDCDRYWVAKTSLGEWEALSCQVGDFVGKDVSLSCPLMRHYKDRSGTDWQQDFAAILKAPEFTDTVNKTMNEISDRAMAMCQAPPCTYTFDSGWVAMSFEEGMSADLYFGYRGMTYQAKGQVTVLRGSDGKPYTQANYTVNAYKAWNFDRDESLSAYGITFPFSGPADAAGYGLAQEFAVTSKSGALTWDSRRG